MSSVRPVGARTTTMLAALAACVTAAGALTGCSADEPIQQPLASISTTTTRMASANIVGLDRQDQRACAAPTEAPFAPDSIAVADPALLDGLCALGLQDRIVGVVGGAPTYLGERISGLPELTARTDAAITLGTASSPAANRASGHTRTLPAPGDGWKDAFESLAAAVRMPAEGRAVLKKYADAVAAAATATDARQAVVSLVRFTEDGKAWAMGTAPLAAQVLADLGAQRPAPQRRSEPVLMSGDDFSAAEGDLIYVSYEGDGGKKAGLQAMTSQPWNDLRAVVAHRQLLVQDASWYSPGGPVAASAVLHDVSNTLNSSS